MSEREPTERLGEGAETNTPHVSEEPSTMPDGQAVTRYPPDDEHWTEEVEELPPRPRRRLLTPLTGALAAVLLAACGFLVGVLVEKAQTPSSGTAGAAAGIPRGGGLAAAGGGGGSGLGFRRGAGAGGDGTVGQVSSVQGRTLYVTDASGNTIAVKIPAGETLTRTATASLHDIHPGDTVIVQGSHGADGSVTASSVRATAQNAGGGGLAQLFGGGSSSSGSARSGAGSGRGGGGVDSLFGGGGQGP